MRKKLLSLLFFIVLSAGIFLFTGCEEPLIEKTQVYLYDSTSNIILDVVNVEKGVDVTDDIPEGYLNKTGYTFVRWAYDKEGENPVDFTKGFTGDRVNIYAIYEINKYNIVYNVMVYNDDIDKYEYVRDGEGFSTQQYYYGSMFNLPTGRNSSGELYPNFIKEGYTFVGWTNEIITDETVDVSDKLYVPGSQYSLSTASDVNFYAYFREKTTTEVCFYDQDLNLLEKKSIDKGTTLGSFPEYSVDGYNLVGWYYDQDCSDQVYDNDIINGEIVNIYPKLIKKIFDVKLFTGIQYEIDSNGVVKNNGLPVIKNILNDVNNEKMSFIEETIEYEALLSIITNNYSTIALNSLNGTPTGNGVGYNEYEFCGWYLDSEYKIPVNEALSEIKIENNRPYVVYKSSDNYEVKVYAEDLGNDSNLEKIYRFNLYSKWERKAYRISFDKNSIRPTGEVDNIVLYKYDEEYGKYYDNGNYSREGYASGNTYTRINFEDLFETEEFITFGNSNNDYRFMGFTSTKSISLNDCTWYYKWGQEKQFSNNLFTEDNNTKINYSGIYSSLEYNHTNSEDIEFFAQWSKIYTITFAYTSGSNQKSFTIKGVGGEWFWLPDENYILETTGEEWTKTHQYFAGWQSAANSQLRKELYKSDGGLNPEFAYVIQKSNETYYVLWKKTPYTVDFLLNDGSADTGTENQIPFTTCYGNDLKTFPQISQEFNREGYIFIGWSTTRYEDNEYIIKKTAGTLTSNEVLYNAGTTFTVKGDITHYAVWIIDYIIKYDYNQGEDSLNPEQDYKIIKYSDFISTPNSIDLTIAIRVGTGINLTKDNYNFIGWGIGDQTLNKSNTQTTTFDFVNQVFYLTSDSETKYTFEFVDGNTIVLTAQWEARVYTVTICDSIATDTTLVRQTISVAFDQPFTFPEKNANGELYDSKIGYQLVGFDTDPNATEPEFKPNDVIESGIITSNVTYYVIYIEQSE